MQRLELIVVVLVAVAAPSHAQDWTKESKDRAKRAALHAASQIVRGDSGKWNDDARMQLAPPITKKPAKLSLDAWANQLLKEKPKLLDTEDIWLLFLSEQLDDNDRVWVQRMERRGQQIRIAANQAKWQGRYFRNFTCYQVIALNLGKLEAGKYEIQWSLQPMEFRNFDGDGKALDSNWPKDERRVDKKPAELRAEFTVSKAP